MEPQPDVLTLRRIYEAERQADRIVREAEGEAAALLRKADEEAAGLLEEMRRRLAARRTEVLNATISAADAEAGKLLEDAKARTELWARKKASGIDDVVERLLETVLPS
jgi:vacuolar-type H+-ATPase subunit H